MLSSLPLNARFLPRRFDWTVGAHFASVSYLGVFVVEAGIRSSSTTTRTSNYMLLDSC